VNYLPGLTLNAVLLITASWVVRITGVSLQHSLALSVFLRIRNAFVIWAWWLTPIIPVTTETESWKMVVQIQPGQKISETKSQPTSWVWWHTSVLLGGIGGRIRV
jgi:hypothetical protein